MRDTKKKILSTARQLFNEKGYESVTMRMIASEVNMSVGNLTYYFPKKENLIRALLDEPDDAPIMKRAKSLQDLADHIRSMLYAIKKNSFFFNDPNLQAFNPDAFENNYENVIKQQGYLKDKLFDLRNEGYFISSFNESEMDDYIRIIMLAHLSWARESNRKSVFTNLNLEAFTALQIRLLKPYCSEKGLTEMKHFE